MSSLILVVDDEPISRALLGEILTAQGYQVVTAQDGQEALACFPRFQPDLVVLDVQMPGLCGFQVCQRLKSNPESRLTPVVLLTAHSAIEDRIRGIEAGADDFLSKPVDQAELLARVHSLLSVKARTGQFEETESVLFALARSIEAKDPYTEGHCERLADYSARLGKRVGLGGDEVIALRRAGIVHDVGKVAVPDYILLKPSRLTAEEWRLVQKHPVIGECICAPLKSFQAVLPIIRHHHEKRDGSGYPDGLQGDQIPLTARVLQVADVYDALTTERSYKRAFSTEEALCTMENEVRKGWWDPYLLSEFRQMIAHSSCAAAGIRGR